MLKLIDTIGLAAVGCITPVANGFAFQPGGVPAGLATRVGFQLAAIGAGCSGVVAALGAIFPFQFCPPVFTWLC
jgi:hypothetical protein